MRRRRDAERARAAVQAAASSSRSSSSRREPSCARAAVSGVGALGPWRHAAHVTSCSSEHGRPYHLGGLRAAAGPNTSWGAGQEVQPYSGQLCGILQPILCPQMV